MNTKKINDARTRGTAVWTEDQFVSTLAGGSVSCSTKKKAGGVRVSKEPPQKKAKGSGKEVAGGTGSAQALPNLKKLPLLWNFKPSSPSYGIFSRGWYNFLL